MSTVPQGPDEVRASDLTPGSVMWDQDLCRVRDVVPFTDGDGRPRVSVVLVPLLADGPVHVVEFLADNVLYLASDAEIAEHRDGDRRRELAAALVDLAERVERKRLPIAFTSTPYVTLRVDGRAELDAWAAALGASVHVDATGRRGVIDTFSGPLAMRVEALLRSPKTSAEASSPSAAGAEGGTGPAAPSGPGAEATPGPDTKTAAEGDNSTTSADASGETDSKGPVIRAAAAPVAPRGMGATGVTPFRFDPVHGVRVLPPAERRASYDQNPTINSRNADQAYAEYADDLDRWVPGWHHDDQQRMAPGLAREANNRLAAEAERDGADQ